MNRCDYTSHKTDYIGLSSETKKTDGVANGSTFHEVDTDKKFIFYCGTWYPVSSFKTGGGGNGVEFKKIDESGRIELQRGLSMGNYAPIVGHDAFYHATGYGFLTKIPFDMSEQTQVEMKSNDGRPCQISILAYGNGKYFGVSQQNGTVYTSTDCITWEMIYDVHIPVEEIISISFSNGDFFFGTQSGNIGVALKSENYNRITDCTNAYLDVAEAGLLQNVFEHFGRQFFVMDSCIISGISGAGEIRRLAFLEEAPDDQYIATTTAFWNNHLVIFDDSHRLIYVMQMRYPYDTSGNFIDPEWHFHGDDWRMEFYPVGVCNIGENLLVFTDRHIFCIDKFGDISRLTDFESSFGNMEKVLIGDKTILVYGGSQNYQLFIK